MDIAKDYVGAVSVKLLDLTHVRRNPWSECPFLKCPFLMNSSQLFHRVTAGSLASTREGERPSCWEDGSHKFPIGDSRSVDASWGTRCVGRTEGDERAQAKEKNHANVGAIPRAEQLPKP